MKLVLASGSIARRRLLAGAGLHFTVDPADIDEPPEGEARVRALNLACEKAMAVSARHPGAVVIGSDQVGTRDDGRDLQKASNEDEAAAQLAALSGRTHTWVSAAALVVDGAVEARVFEKAVVRFRAFDVDTARRYAALGEWRGCAGSYQIENRGAQLVASVEGPLHAVLGLPLFSLLEVLRHMGAPDTGLI
jgi:septum formation protein